MSNTGDQYELKIVANDQAATVVDKLAGKVEDLTDGKHEIDITADAGGAEKETKSLAELIEGLTDKQKEIVLKAQITSAEADLKRLERSLKDVRSIGDDELQIRLRAIDNATEDLEEARKLRDDLDAKDVEIRVDVSQSGTQSLQGLKGDLDGVRDSGDQSKSVLANMAGNTAQDLGAVGGVVGSLGVGLGQLAEYATEGNIQLSNLAAVAGPMLGLAAAGLAVNEMMAEQGKRAEAQRVLVEGWADAVESGVDPVQSLTDSQRELNEEMKVTDRFATAKSILPWVDSVKSLDNMVVRAGLTMEQFNQLVYDGPKAIGEWITAQRAAGESVPTDLISAFGESMDALEESQRRGEVTAKLFALSTDAIAASMQRLALEKDPIAAFPAEFQRIADALAVGTTPAVADVDAVMKGLNITLDDAIGLASDLAAEQSGVASTARDLALAQHEAESAALAHKRGLDTLFGKLGDEQMWIGVQQQFNSLEDSAAAAFDAAASGSADADDKLLTYQADLVTTKQKVADYAVEVLGLPEDVVTDIVAELDPESGRTLAEVEATLLNLSKGVTVPINYVEGRRPISGAYAHGGTVHTSGFQLFGEEGPEIAFAPAGTQVLTAAQTRQALSGASGTTTVINNFPPGIGLRQFSRAQRSARRRGFGRAS